MDLENKINKIIAPILRNLIFKKELTRDDMDSILQITIQKIVHELKAESITLYLVEKDNKIHFKYVYFSPLLYGNDLKKKELFEKQKQKLLNMKLDLGTGIVGKVIETGESYTVLDTSKEKDFYAKVDEELGFKTKSMITVPLITEKIIGAIQVINKHTEEGIFSEEDVVLLEEVATYSAKIIQKVYFPETKFTEKELAYYISQLTGSPYIELDEDFDIDAELLAIIPWDIYKKYPILPLKRVGKREVRVVMPNPLDYEQIENFEKVSNLKIKDIVVAPQSDIRKVLDKYVSDMGGKETSVDVTGTAELVKEEFKESADKTIEISDEAESEGSAPIIQLANQLIKEAFAKNASDIHIEAFENHTKVRYRVDGVLREYHKLPRKAHNALIARYKIMSGLNIAEKRKPQDGRIKFKQFGRNNPDIELRVSVAPMYWGEKVVMRILASPKNILNLELLGFSDYNLKLYRDAIKKPWGMILNVGPTGSGKTTTLYAALNEVNKPDINISTAEDPVEIMLEGVNQLPIRHEIGLNFAEALRCFLRQDPDIIMVGEIRDTETAEIAIEAALTGHLLFSTLHTNDAASTVTRFIEMGVEPYLLTSTLLLVCAQRLVRRICSDCKISYEATEEECEALKIPKGSKLFRGEGCKKCDGTGYKGRLGVHEILVLNENLKKLILKRASSDDINRQALEDKLMIPLFKDGVAKAIEGKTTSEEVLRVLRSE